MLCRASPRMVLMRLHSMTDEDVMIVGRNDLPTIVALGLDPLSLGLASTGETTGQALGDGTPEQQRAQGTPGLTMPQNGGGQAR